ncbi:MAG: F0F1 ATP synthase subunit B [Alphaproteobacteria bacterium]|nr:F0F1 ATP synthase subunit B [Alphaproteobacteria bacterium]
MEETVAHTETAHAETAHHEPFYADPAFWVSVSFVIFMVLALKPILRIITNGLDNRAERIGKELAEAEKLRKEAQAVLDYYLARQKDVLREAEEILERSKQEADRITKDAKVNLEETLKKRMEMASQKIAQAEKMALQEIKEHTVAVAITAAQSLLKDQLSEGNIADTLISDAANDIETKLH